MPKKVYPLTLESDAFNALKRDFDSLLERTLSTMRQKDGERAVVDSFEGKESYEKVMQNKRFYLAGDYSLPMLEMNA